MSTACAIIMASALAAGAVQVPFSSERWTIRAEAADHVEYGGRAALRLQNGVAVLDDVSIQNGVLEFAVAFSGDRGFVGAIWRVVDFGNHEYFYLRPHQSGNPDANQYTPVYNGLPGWQLYHGPGYGTPVAYPYGEWIPVRIEFWNDQARVFIGDMEVPAVKVPELKRRSVSGPVGIRAQNAPAYVSRFTYRGLESPPFEPLPVPDASTPPGTVTEWEVSSPFDASRLHAVRDLRATDFSDLDWQPLRSERTGIANLASLHGVSAGRDTVFAKVMVHADQAGLRALRFGYSDRVTVFVNGSPVYSGDNTYGSRDYRYLGTIGLFDSVYLPLQAGTNEVTFAVTETFGGWGVIARLEQ